MFVPTHTCSSIYARICVTSVNNLLLSLFGPCLESQCTLCGEPEGEWASPFPEMLVSSSSPSLLFAIRGGWEAERGRGFAADTLFFSLHLSKAMVWSSFLGSVSKIIKDTKMHCTEWESAPWFLFNYCAAFRQQRCKFQSITCVGWGVYAQCNSRGSHVFAHTLIDSMKAEGHMFGAMTNHDCFCFTSHPMLRT